MSKERIVVVATRYRVGRRNWYDPVGKLLFKELDQMPESTTLGTGDPTDRALVIDGRKLRDFTFGKETLRNVEGITFNVLRCGIGWAGEGEKEFQELLEAGWTTEEPK